MKKKTQKPKVTQEVKDMAKKIQADKWDSKTESAYDYVERIAKQRRGK